MHLIWLLSIWQTNANYTFFAYTTIYDLSEYYSRVEVIVALIRLMMFCAYLFTDPRSTGVLARR